MAHTTHSELGAELGMEPRISAIVQDPEVSSHPAHSPPVTESALGLHSPGQGARNTGVTPTVLGAALYCGKTRLALLSTGPVCRARPSPEPSRAMTGASCWYQWDEFWKQAAGALPQGRHFDSGLSPCAGLCKGLPRAVGRHGAAAGFSGWWVPLW